MVFANIFTKTKKFAKLFSLVHMGPRSNLYKQKNCQKSHYTVPLNWQRASKQIDCYSIIISNFLVNKNKTAFCPIYIKIYLFYISPSYRSCVLPHNCCVLSTFNFKVLYMSYCFTLARQNAFNALIELLFKLV